MINFTMLENNILNYNLSGQAFKLYFILKSYCFNNKSNCYPSQKTLAEKSKTSIRTVQRALKELKNAGLIKIKRRGSISNIYELTNIDPVKTSTNEKQSSKDYSNNYKSHNYSNKKDNFNNFEQRNYNFEELEKALLGRNHESLLINS